MRLKTFQAAGGGGSGGAPSTRDRDLSSKPSSVLGSENGNGAVGLESSGEAGASPAAVLVHSADSKLAEGLVWFASKRAL